MADKRKGEKDITLNGIDYKMIVDMGVISEFESETGEDFMHLAIKATNAYAKGMKCETMLDRAEVMSKAVSLKNAAWLFYLAAKKGNSRVEFGEIQEAMLEDLDVVNDNLFYPVLFTDLVSFALVGEVKKKTKKKR